MKINSTIKKYKGVIIQLIVRGGFLNKEKVVKTIENGLIVSCQALPDEPMYREAGGVMPLFAEAAKRAGAVAIRANSARDIKEIKEQVDLPVIGIVKRDYPDTQQYITVSMKEIDELVEVGVDIIALDATLRARFDGRSLDEYVSEIKDKYPNQLLMADIATYEEGLNAARLGFDFIGTTLSGYTEESKNNPVPNFDLVKKLSESTDIPIVAEGQIVEPCQARQMLEVGAHTVVVGGAITRPQQIAEGFIKEIKKVKIKN